MGVGAVVAIVVAVGAALTTDSVRALVIGLAAAVLALVVSLAVADGLQRAVMRTDAHPAAKVGTADALDVGPQLNGVDLRGARLLAAQLDRADLADARLDGANLADARLEGALLAGAAGQQGERGPRGPRGRRGPPGRALVAGNG